MAELPRPRVVIADDREENRYVLSRVLEGAGFDCTQTGTGLGALDAARTIPDVIILDLDSLNRRGPDTVRAIRRTCPDLPLIVLSSYPIDVNELFEHPGPGLVIFVLKSCSGEEIITAVRTVVGNRRLRDNSRPP